MKTVAKIKNKIYYKFLESNQVGIEEPKPLQAESNILPDKTRIRIISLRQAGVAALTTAMVGISAPQAFAESAVLVTGGTDNLGYAYFLDDFGNIVKEGPARMQTSLKTGQKHRKTGNKVYNTRDLVYGQVRRLNAAVYPLTLGTAEGMDALMIGSSSVGFHVETPKYRFSDTVGSHGCARLKFDPTKIANLEGLGRGTDGNDAALVVQTNQQAEAFIKEIQANPRLGMYNMNSTDDDEKPKSNIGKR
jgi:hypothetical protein